MFLGQNLQFLRKNNGMTQENLAQRMGVSRQTVSKWESGEASPELTKLLELGDVFSCKLDTLLREDLAARESLYSPVRVVRVKGFRMARYVVISPRPEADAAACLDVWARENGLLDISGAAPTRIGWNFPYVSAEQKNRFGLRGYAAAYLLPEGFHAESGAVEIAAQGDADYAVMTIRDPFAAAYDRIPQAYQMIFDYLSRSGLEKSAAGDALPGFHRVRRSGGTECMDVFVHCQGAVSPPEYYLMHIDLTQQTDKL